MEQTPTNKQNMIGRFWFNWQTF